MVLSVAALTGCSTLEAVGSDDTWLYYDGDRRDLVMLCIDDLPAVVSGEGYKGNPVVSNINVETSVIDDARSSHSVTGVLTLAPSEFDWSCRVSQRYTMLDVRELTAEER